MAVRRPKVVPSAERIEDEIKALELRRAGVTYPEIGQQLGINPGTAHRYVFAALARTQQEPADEVRKIEVDRLDRMQRAYWPGVLRGDEKAGQLMLRIQERRAKLLGLDAPVKHDVTLTDAVSAEIAELAQQLGANDQTPVQA